jgi:hypothetical protein
MLLMPLVPRTALGPFHNAPTAIHDAQQRTSLAIQAARLRRVFSSSRARTTTRLSRSMFERWAAPATFLAVLTFQMRSFWNSLASHCGEEDRRNGWR